MMTSNASLNLDDQLCFALYAATNAITRVYRGPLAELGLTYPQYLAMLVLWEHGEQTVRSLADRLELDSSTLTPVLKRLAAAGFISRERDGDDERVVRIGLTRAGTALREPAARVHQRGACRTRLSEKAFVELRSRLHKLTQDMALEPDDEAAYA